VFFSRCLLVPPHIRRVSLLEMLSCGDRSNSSAGHR